MSAKKILIADDEPIIQELLCLFLENLGHNVKSVSNGKEAMKLCEQEEFDLIISDVRMPGGDGICFLQQLRAQKQPLPKFVFMTGFSDQSTNLLLSEGAIHVFHKPFMLEELEKFL